VRFSARQTISSSLSASALSVAIAFASGGCGGSDSDGVDAAPEQTFDAGPADAAVGVVCQNAQASYAGTLNGPTAEDDGQSLVFFGQLDATDDGLRVAVASTAAANGTVQFPDPVWSVAVCLDDANGDCGDPLVAYSGTMVVTSVEDRFRASLDEVIFVDDLEAPTCSAALSQASFDVAILGPI